MKRTLIALAACSVTTLLGACNEYSDKDIVIAPLADVRSLTQDAAKDPKALLLIDARAPKYYAAAHIPGAINLEVPNFDKKAGTKARLESYSEMIIYGDNPGSNPAKALTKRLLEVGYKDVRFYAGGLDEWKSAGLPVDSSGSVAPGPAR